ncbi:MAG TPA: YdbH domain-containing protein [Sphingomicrobium sp.]
MAERSREAPASDGADSPVVVRRRPWWRFASFAAIGVLLLLALAIAVLWIERRPIATHYLKREFEQRGVQASYRLDRVGLRTQQVSDLVIGDPKHPDLVARRAIVQMRIKWNGSFEVYRIVARGVRLRGKLVNGKVSWGQIDKLLPPPSKQPFRLPEFVLDVADSSISLVTPFGPVGIAIHGTGNLSGGFKGRLAIASPRLVPGRCAAVNLRANVAVAVVARRPRVDGPVTLDRFTCPASRFDVTAPRFDAQARFNEAFTNVDGRGRMAIPVLVAGANGLAAFAGELTYKGSLANVRGDVKLSAQKSRLATIYANRTRLDARYGLGLRAGTFSLAGDFAADSSTLDPSMLAGVTEPLKAAAATPLGPIATSIGNAISRTARNFDATGHIRVVNFPGGGAARIDQAEVTGPGGGRVRVAGGSGLTYYWPAGALRFDTSVEMSGGGLPNGRVTLRQAKPGAPLSGVADFAPFTAGGSRLALAPIRFGPGPGGTTALSTFAQLDGPFPDGRVKALRLPITGRIGRGGSFAFGTSCAVVSFNALRTGMLQLGSTRLPVCPIGPAIVSKRPGGPVLASARFNGPVLNGRLGSSPFHLAAAGGRIVGKQFSVSDLAMRLGKSEAPVVFDAARLTGSFTGKGISGAFSGARSTIGDVPLLLTDVGGRWRVYKGDITVDGGLLLSDRDANPRFYALRSDNVHFTLAGDWVRTTGTLKHPASGTRVAEVAIAHRLSSGAGDATLDVPGITFGDNLQPEELTRLTEGVVALVYGTIRGQGRIAWSAGGKVTSTGDFTTASLDLAAPFGPVKGMSGTIHFSDLLGLETPPGQQLDIRSINPGILVQNGVIRYQLLPGQLVKIERGEWPFMGGRLILEETVLNFARPTPKRLTFDVVGLDAKTFVDSLGFAELNATGTFDGVLPMIFDEAGGRIVGGRLDSRPPGGTLSYVGTINRANLGMLGNLAFDALKDLRYRSMIVRLDGDLAGEFATRITIEQLGLAGRGGISGIIQRAFKNVPFRFNITIKGPFRSLIQTAKSYRDPRQQIDKVLPRPLEDIPGIVTEVRRRDEDKEQTQTPVEQTVTPTPPSER